MTTLIGQPISRVDGPLKVSGRATYAAECKPRVGHDAALDLKRRGN